MLPLDQLNQPEKNYDTHLSPINKSKVKKRTLQKGNSESFYLLNHQNSFESHDPIVQIGAFEVEAHHVSGQQLKTEVDNEKNMLLISLVKEISPDSSFHR